jgi:hypothetical protein
MLNRGILIGIILFLLGQTIIWYQTNLQFISEWAKSHKLLLSLLGVPVSYLFILATSYTVEGFNGQLWPSRLIGFSVGMIVMAFLTYFHISQGINIKTFITLLLALCIVLIQVFWK